MEIHGASRYVSLYLFDPKRNNSSTSRSLLYLCASTVGRPKARLAVWEDPILIAVVLVR